MGFGSEARLVCTTRLSCGHPRTARSLRSAEHQIQSTCPKHVHVFSISRCRLGSFRSNFVDLPAQRIRTNRACRGKFGVARLLGISFRSTSDSERGFHTGKDARALSNPSVLGHVKDLQAVSPHSCGKWKVCRRLPLDAKVVPRGENPAFPTPTGLASTFLHTFLPLGTGLGSSPLERSRHRIPAGSARYRRALRETRSSRSDPAGHVGLSTSPPGFPAIFGHITGSHDTTLCPAGQFRVFLCQT